MNAPHTNYMQALERPSEKPSEAETLRGILARAENHLAYIKAKGATESVVYGEHQYIDALKLVLTRIQ